MSPAHSHEDNVSARGGKDEPLVAGRDEGKGEEEGEGREGVDQGHHRLYLVLAPALVLQSMFICSRCDENGVSSRRFLQPRTRLTAYIHSQKQSYMCAACLGNLALSFILPPIPPLLIGRLHVTFKQLFLHRPTLKCRQS